MTQDYSKKLENYQKYKKQQAQFYLKKDIDNITKEADSFGKPSLVKYGFLFIIAGIVDIVDALGLDVVSWLGYITALVVSLIGSFIIMFTLWMTDTKQGQAKEYIDGLEKKIVKIQKNIRRGSKAVLKSGKFLRKFKSTKKAGNAILKTMGKVRKTMKTSPVGRIALGSALNIVPILGAINLMVVWIYFSYRGEKKAYEEAKRMGEEAAKNLQNEMNEMQNSEIDN